MNGRKSKQCKRWLAEEGRGMSTFEFDDFLEKCDEKPAVKAKFAKLYKRAHKK